MTSPNNIVPQGDTSKQRVVDAARQLRRRRLVTGAGAGFMVLGSRSVLGSECYNPSETLSGAKSHTGKDLPVCNGDSAGIWWQAAKPKGEPGGRGRSGKPGSSEILGTQGNVSWFALSPALPGDGTLGSKPWDTPFHAIFPHGNIFGSMSLFQVLDAHQSGKDLPGNLGFHIVGALLNIRAGWIDGRAMTEDYLVNRLWADYVGPGFRPTPTAGVWSESDIVYYLKSTGIVG